MEMILSEDGRYRSYESSEKVQELISLIKKRFIRTDGLLARTYPTNENTRTLFDNFDDIVPFFLYFGEAEFLLEQTRLIEKMELDIVDICALHGVVMARNVDEWIGGLYALWKTTGDKQPLKLLKESLAFIEKYMLVEGNLFAAYYVDNAEVGRYVESWASGFLEDLFEMKDDFPELFDIGRMVLMKWISSDYFKQYGLFPYRVFTNTGVDLFQKHVVSWSSPIVRNSRPPSRGTDPGFRGKARDVLRKIRFFGINGRYSQMMKSNSTCAFALLEAYRATGESCWKESLGRWLKSATECFYENGKVYSEFLPKRQLKSYPAAGPAFIFVDVICDSAYFIEEFKEYMGVAKDILDYNWWNRMANGLIPIAAGGKVAHIDNQVDFSVSMRRYGEISGDRKYLQKAVTLMENVIAEHSSPEGYISYSGNLNLNNNVIDPKYNALLLKGFINIMTIEDSLYAEHYSLFKDR